MQDLHYLNLAGVPPVARRVLQEVQRRPPAVDPVPGRGVPDARVEAQAEEQVRDPADGPPHGAAEAARVPAGHVPGAYHQVRAGRLREGHHLGGEGGVVLPVAVHDHEVLVAHVHRPPDSLEVGGDQAHPAPPLHKDRVRVAGDHLLGPVRGSVVDDYHGRPARAAQDLGDAVPLVQRRDHERVGGARPHVARSAV